MEQSKLILVGGAYKSGTSLLCSLLEEAGYYNPAFITSPIEYGHGINKPLYLTRECIISRALNRRLVIATRKEKDKIVHEVRSYLIDVFQECGNRILLKDPYFKFTADVWSKVAVTLGASVEIHISVRDMASVYKSWMNSRFMRWLIKRDPLLLERMCAPVSNTVKYGLSETKATLLISNFDNLTRPMLKHVGGSSCDNLVET